MTCTASNREALTHGLHPYRPCAHHSRPRRRRHADDIRPGYDRSQVTAGVAHIGVGNFHRVHQGVYLDDLLAARTDHNEWGIVGVGLRDQNTSKAKAHAYEQQNYLHTVTLYANDGRQPRASSALWSSTSMGPLIRRLPVARLTDPAIRIVSLTSPREATTSMS
jgi:mannitol 2-dehydrogenase